MNGNCCLFAFSERSENNSPSKSSTSKIDEEYHSTDNESEINNSDDMSDEKEYEKEIQWRKRYIPAATVSSASEIGSFVNEARKKDHAWGEGSSEDEKSKKVQGRGQR